MLLQNISTPWNVIIMNEFKDDGSFFDQFRKLNARKNTATQIVFGNEHAGTIVGGPEADTDCPSVSTSSARLQLARNNNSDPVHDDQTGIRAHQSDPCSTPKYTQSEQQLLNVQKLNPTKESEKVAAADKQQTRKRSSRWDIKATGNKEAKLDAPGVYHATSLNTGVTSTKPEESTRSVDVGEQELLDLRVKMKARATAMLALERIAPEIRAEFDSDDVEGNSDGTWEHRARLQEMERTGLATGEINRNAEGKHHLDHFLPVDQVAKFGGVGSAPDVSDYREHKLTADNRGFQILQKLGWKGGGLGANETGREVPIDKGRAANDMQGLGSERMDELGKNDDEYSAYRKRMMAAYKYRPNPLNNPRRKYY